MTQAKQYERQIKVPATYMRGGTSKGVFIQYQDLPELAKQPGKARDELLLRIIGSPDPYGKHIDGMGGATSSTSKAVIISPSKKPDHDVDYLFGQVAIDKGVVDWSGNCGNLSSAVGPFAVANGYIPPERIPENGMVEVRVWQANIKKTIVIQVPVQGGQVQELGDFLLDGVAFPAAEIQVDFMDPADSDGHMFPTGNRIDDLQVEGLGGIKATMINAGIPTVFVDAKVLGLSGKELQDEINNAPELLAKFESIRAAAALKMGLIEHLSEAEFRQHTPKVAFVSQGQSYLASSGNRVESTEVDLLVRALSMGKLHHAMMGTAAVAIACAASVPETLVNLAAGGGSKKSVVFGHPSGTLKVGAQAEQTSKGWVVKKASMSRSARVLMEGWVKVPPVKVR